MGNPKTNNPLKILGYMGLTVATIVGIIAIIQRFNQGLIITNMTQHIPWGFWIVLYIYFIGLSAGSFLLSTLIYVFGVKRLEAAGRMALFQAFICMLLGLFLIFIDLGHPERFYKVITSMNPTSVLSWESLLYTIYCLIILLELYRVTRVDFINLAASGKRFRWLYRLLSLGSHDTSAESVKKDYKWLKVLGIIGIPVAVGVHGGTGTIFAVAKGRPIWFSSLFPIVFLVSALASGGALLTFLMAFFYKMETEAKRSLLQFLARLTAGILAIDLLLLFCEILVALYGEIPHDVAAWRIIYAGYYGGVIFWGLQLLLGSLIPIILIAHPKTGRSIRWLGLASFLIVLGVLGVRINIVIPPLIYPAFAELPNAYHHFRFALGYSPSLNEWLVSIGSICFVIWGFIIANKVMPLRSGSLGGAKDE